MAGSAHSESSGDSSSHDGDVERTSVHKAGVASVSGPIANADDGANAAESVATEPDPRGVPQVNGGVTYAAPSSFDGVQPKDTKAIATIPWFSTTAVRAGADDDYAQLVLYAWDGLFYWGVESEALSSRVWRDVIAVDDADLSYFGSSTSKMSRHVAEVMKGMVALPSGPLVEEADVDVDIWRYRYYGERSYVRNLCGIPDETLAAWRGRYMVHEDAVLWERAILPTRFRYFDRRDDPFWDKQAKWERRTLSVMGRFVPYHLICAYGLTESARDRLLVRILSSYKDLEVPQEFRFEQEPVFSYKSSLLISDRGTGLWVVAYTERVVRVCAAVLYAAYDEYVLWYVPPDIINFARQLGMAMAVPLGSCANVREVLEMLTVIESTVFSYLPSPWNERTHRATDYHPGPRDEGADFVYYDPWQRCKVDAKTAISRKSATRVVPMDMPYGWMHEEDDRERTPRDASRDFNAYRVMDEGMPGDNALNVIPANSSRNSAYVGAGASNLALPAAEAEVAVVRHFLEGAGVLRADDGSMTISEMRAFVRGRMNR